MVAVEVERENLCNQPTERKCGRVYMSAYVCTDAQKKSVGG